MQTRAHTHNHTTHKVACVTMVDYYDEHRCIQPAFSYEQLAIEPVARPGPLQKEALFLESTGSGPKSKCWQFEGSSAEICAVLLVVFHHQCFPQEMMTTRQDVLELREELQDPKHFILIKVRGSAHKSVAQGSGSNWTRATRGSCRAPQCFSSMP